MRERAANAEATTAHAVAAHLLAEGRHAADLRRVPEGSGRSPDFMLAVDGVDVALEVVRFIDERQAKAEAGVRLFERALKVLLDPIAKQMSCQVALDLTFDTDQLQDYGLRDAKRDAELIAPAIIAALSPVPLTLTNIESAVLWLLRPGLQAFYSPADPSFFIGSTAPKGHFRPEAAEFVPWVIEAKGDQHLGHSDTAMLAILCEGDDTDELVTAFDAACEPVPWARVYAVWSGGNARLVHPKP